MNRDEIREAARKVAEAAPPMTPQLKRRVIELLTPPARRDKAS